MLRMNVRSLVMLCAAFFFFSSRVAIANEVFDSLEDATAYVDDALAESDSDRHGAVIVLLDSDEDEPKQVKCIFQMFGGRNYYSFRTNQVLARLIPASVDSAIRLRIPGYHEVFHEFKVKPGEIVVLDDLSPIPVGADDAVTFTGIVKLEGNANPAGLRVRVNDKPTTTDQYGRFTMEGVGAGEVRVSASAAGYCGMHKTLEARQGERNFVMLNGWLIRHALVRWGYQPDSSRFLDSGIETGLAIIADNGLDRISFAEGFKQVQGESDFAVRQVNDRLVLRNFDGGRGRPGILRLQETGFDEVVRAPDVKFPRKPLEIKEGDVFVFKCFDGEHFGKLEVLEIVDNQDDYLRLVSEMARE